MSNPVSKLPPIPGLPNELLQAGEAANDNVARTAGEIARKRWAGPAASEVESFASKFLRIGTGVGSKLLFYAQFLELEGDTPHHERAASPAIDKPPEGKTVMQWLSEMAEAEKIAARIAALRSELELAKKQGQTARVHALNAELNAIYAQIETVFSAAPVQGRYLQATASAGAAATTSGDTSSGIDPNNLDRSVKPSDDFNRFVNGGWLDRTAIPDGYPAFGSFSELRVANQERFRGILDAAIAVQSPQGSAMQKLGDFYYSGMDEVRLNQVGAAPLHVFLKMIEDISLGQPEKLEECVAWLLRHKIPGVFVPIVDADPKDSSKHILTLDQGGLGLPERDYYFRDDEKSIQLRAAYVDHIAKTFMVLGDSDALAREKAAAVMTVETTLAKSSLTPTERRDLNRQYNKIPVTELQVLMPHWDWDELFTGMGVSEVSHVILTHPDFFNAMDHLRLETPKNHWQAYLTWQWVSGASDYLGDRFADHKFDFYGKTLEGMTAQRPRSQRVLEQLDAWLGDALGRVFVERYFPESSKQRVNAMVDNLIGAFRDRIQSRDWMSDETKAAALEKLDKVARNLGFPDQWKDYATADISRDSYLQNVLHAREYEFGRTVGKLLKPVDRGEWSMTAPTVNAEYDFGRNRLLFPAGILQPPFFNADADDPVNYGAIGAIIGHELTHGFDDQGSQYDADGNMRNWWTAADNTEFQARTAQLVRQFSTYKVAEGLYIDGQLTLGENVADLGGLVMAYYALQKSLEKKPRVMVDGFTPEQRFFMGWAQVWRIHFTPKALEKYVRTNVHSPGRFRVVGPMSNMPEFYEAWGVQEGDAMCRPPNDRTEIW